MRRAARPPRTRSRAPVVAARRPSAAPVRAAPPREAIAAMQSRPSQLDAAACLEWLAASGTDTPALPRAHSGETSEVAGALLSKLGEGGSRRHERCAAQLRLRRVVWARGRMRRVAELGCASCTLRLGSRARVSVARPPCPPQPQAY